MSLAQTLVADYHKIMHVALEVEAEALKLIGDAEKAKPIVDKVLAVVDPKAASIEATVYTVFEKVGTAVEGADAATMAGGLNVTLDAALANDVKAIWTYLKGKSGKA